MPNRGQQLGKRRPFTRRPGIGKFPPWDGKNREGDPASVPANAFRELINTRTEDSEIRSRGGQRALNADTVDGCITGIWPPEYEPPDQTFTRLLISETEPQVGTVVSYVFAPDEQETVRTMSSNFQDVNKGLYWSGERLLAMAQVAGDGTEGHLLEHRLTKVNGLTEINADDSEYDRISFVFTGGATSSVGYPVIHNSNYYVAVMESSAITLKEITFSTDDFVATDVDTGDFADTQPLHFATKTPDGRVLWFNNDGVGTGTDALLSLRDQDGVFTDVTFPLGFLPNEDSMISWCWFNAKLYIGGDNGSGALGIAVYDPVANTISLGHSVALSVPARCSMAVHKGILYFSYETSGGAHRIGTLRANVWTDSVISISNPDPIVHMCSFQSYLYVTKGEFLFRASDLYSTGVLDVFFENETGNAMGYMVAVP